MQKALEYGLVLVVGVSCTHAAMAGGAVRGRAAVHGGIVGSGDHAAAQGYLGVDVRDVTPDQLNALKLREPHGAEITLVDHDAPAGKAGLREHDVVLQMNGQFVQGREQIRRMLQESAPGKTVVLLISRDGLQMTVTAQMANKEAVERQAWQNHLTVPDPGDSQPNEAAGAYTPPQTSTGPTRGNSFMGKMLLPTPSHTGAVVEMMTKQLAEFFGSPNGTGLLVRSVEGNSPAALAGMRAGDVVIRANTQPVANTKDWFKAIEASHGRPVPITVLRDKKETVLTVTPDSKKHSRLDFVPPFGQPNPANTYLSRFC
jgi:serine protease Do